MQKHGDKRRKRCENNGDKKQAGRELVVVGRGIRQAVAGKIKIFVKIKRQSGQDIAVGREVAEFNLLQHRQRNVRIRAELRQGNAKLLTIGQQQKPETGIGK